jgi:nitroimidazol reductase NimA-like FMN-containing flavoprotein (pyridoxamine 5'-phosphate oxidase superfamily)
MTEIVHQTFPFDVEAFLAEGNACRLATNGPTVRPLWYHWENGAFWLISGPHAKLYERIQKDPRVSLVIDVYEVDTGRVLQVMATGKVNIAPYDTARARRMLVRYLGADESTWSTKPDDYPGYVRDNGPPGCVWLKLQPKRVLTFNFSFGLDFNSLAELNQ